MKINVTIDVSPPILQIIVRTDQFVITLDNRTRRPLKLLESLLEDIVYTQCIRSTTARTNRLYVRTMNARTLSSLWARNTRRRARQAAKKGG